MNVEIKTTINDTLNNINSTNKSTKSKFISVDTNKISQNADDIKSLELTTLNSENSDTNKYSYEIEEYMETDIKNINANTKYIFFCIYKIEQSNTLPYLQYILYKYPNNLMVFPFIEIKNNTNNNADYILNLINDYIIDITGTTQTIKGYIEKENKLFVFVNLNNSTDKTTNVNLKTQEHKLWWCLIDEICNKNKVLNYPVHKSVIDIFNNNKYLMYIKNQNKKYISLPNVLYMCDTKTNIINFIKLNKYPKNKYNIKKGLILNPIEKILYNKKWLYSYKDTYKLIRCSVFFNNKIKPIYDIEYNKIPKHLDLKNNDCNIITNVKFFTKYMNLEEYVINKNIYTNILSYHDIEKNVLQ